MSSEEDKNIPGNIKTNLLETSQRSNSSVEGKLKSKLKRRASM